MTGNKAPLAEVNEQGGKEKLVDRIMGLIDRGEEDAEALKQRLLAASNKKLLRLAQIGETMKTQYSGSREKLAEGVAQALGRAKDNDYVKTLATYTPARLLDMVQTATRKAAGEARGVAEKAKGAAREAGEAAGKAVKKVTTRAKAAAKGAATRAKAAAGKAKAAAGKAKAAAKKPTSKRK